MSSVGVATRAVVLAATLLAASEVAPALARSLEAIKTRGFIGLCAPPNALPFASRNGPRRGIDIDLAQAIANKLGLALRVDWVTQSYQYRLLNCDIVMDVMVAPDVVQEIPMRRSIPYQRSGVALGLRVGLGAATGFADLPKGTRVAVQVGSLAQSMLGKRGIDVVPFGFEDEMVEAVASGEVDAAAVTPTSVNWFNHEHPDRAIRLVYTDTAEPDLSWNLAIGVRQADDAFAREINTALRSLLDDGTVARIYASYGAEHRPPLDTARERGPSNAPRP